MSLPKLNRKSFHVFPTQHALVLFLRMMICNFKGFNFLKEKCVYKNGAPVWSSQKNESHSQMIFVLERINLLTHRLHLFFCCSTCSKRHRFLFIFSVCLLQIIWCVESSMIMSNKTSFFNDKDSCDLCIQNVCRIHKVITFMFLRLRCLISLFVFWNISN